MRRDKNIVQAIQKAHALLSLLAVPSPATVEAKKVLRAAMTPRELVASQDATIDLASKLFKQEPEDAGTD